MEPDPGQTFSGTARKARGAVRRAARVYTATPWGCVRVPKKNVLRLLREMNETHGQYWWHQYADGNLHLGTGPWSLWFAGSTMSGCATTRDERKGKTNAEG